MPRDALSADKSGAPTARIVDQETHEIATIAELKGVTPRSVRAVRADGGERA